MSEFKSINIITAVIALILCLILLLFPEFIFYLFGIQEHDSAFFIGRRASMLFLGISVLLWASKNSKNSEPRQAICIGLAVSMIALAILGTAEYLRGFAGMGIFLAVITEFLLGAAYLKIWLYSKNA